MSANQRPVIRARVPLELLTAVDALGRRHGLSRSEALRYLLLRGLERAGAATRVLGAQHAP